VAAFGLLIESQMFFINQTAGTQWTVW
jgi:hypothetical protein